MSCDSVRRNLKAIPMEAGGEWIWNANLHLVEAPLDQDYILDMDPTVKPLLLHARFLSRVRLRDSSAAGLRRT